MHLKQPKIVIATLEPIDAGQLVAEATFERISLTNVNAAGLLARNLSFDEAVLEKAHFTEARLEKLRLTDTRLISCDLSAAQCSDSSIIRTHCIGGRMTGIDLSRSTIKDVVFENCKLNMANFRFTKLTRVQFINCTLTEADFQAAELSQVEFQGCHLEKTEFAQSKIKRVDMRSSQLIDIRGWQSLHGLTIDSAQLVSIAPQLALELGLIIEDE